MRIFLSHSHRDRAIAEALCGLLADLFGERVQVEYSSDQTAGGGIPPGDQWLPWITKRITEADNTYVLLTPNSMHNPWVLWESGAAAGVALATNKPRPVVPITFGISDNDLPSPFLGTEYVRGDSTDAGGIHRLLQGLNRQLKSPLTEKAFHATTDGCLPNFIDKVGEALRESAPIVSLLASIPHSFSADKLGGFWVTCYEFKSGPDTFCHADIAELTPESDRHVTVKNHRPPPRTEGHSQPFLNEIKAELASRHLIGHWKNISDTRYFGAIHLSVLTGESVMEGYYTCFSSDVVVGCGFWKWVRIDRKTIEGVDLSRVVLHPPRDIKGQLATHEHYAGPLRLEAVAELT